jgi:carbonic anhydrase
MIDELLAYNQAFVAGKEYEKYISDKYPNKKLAILTCMDTRLTELLPAALGMKNGDVKMIKNAGAIVSSPFGSVMRSLLVAIYNLEVQAILVIGHRDCGMESIDSHEMLAKMKMRGITDEKLTLIQYCGVSFKDWLRGFACAEESVKATVANIQGHPLIPADIQVYGLIMDPHTGKAEKV